MSPLTSSAVEKVGKQAGFNGRLSCGYWPKISVITPSFNQGQFLEETLLSVLSQKYPNLEYLVYDGGSQDQSVHVLRKYDDRLAYWESMPDCGQANAINKGLERCRGEIIAYLNSDDTYLPGTLITVARYFADHPEVDLIYGDCKIVDEHGSYLETWISRPFDPVVELCRNFIFQPTVFWRRRLYEQVGMFNEKLLYVMDIDYWYRALPVGKFAYLEKELACFRIHTASKTSRRGSFVEERGRILDEFFERNCGREIAKYKDLIYAWHHFHAGEEFYGRGALPEAMCEFARSLKYTPASLRSWYVLLAAIDRVCNSRFLAMMQRVHRLSPKAHG